MKLKLFSRHQGYHEAKKDVCYHLSIHYSPLIGITTGQYGSLGVDMLCCDLRKDPSLLATAEPNHVAGLTRQSC
jgi:hypothetical protein